MADNETSSEIELEIKNDDLEIEVEMKTKSVEEGAKKVQSILNNLTKTADEQTGRFASAFESAWAEVNTVLTDMGTMIINAFTVDSPEALAEATTRFGTTFANELYAVQANLGGLQTAIVDAVVPIAQVFVPIINDALTALSDMVNGIGQVISAIFGTVTATDALAASTESAAGSATGAINLLPATVNDTFSPQIQSIVDKVQSLLVPLQQIDLTPIMTAFGSLQTVFAPLTQELFAGLEWAYINLFAPLATWATEGLLPVFLETLGSVLTTITETITALQPMGTWLWDNLLQPIAEWTGGVIVDTLTNLKTGLDEISTWISENQAYIEAMVTIIGSIAAGIGLVNVATELWTVISTIAKNVTQGFGAAMGAVNWPVTLIAAAIGALIAIIILLVENWDTVKAAALSVWEAIKEAFGNAWKWFKDTLLDPLVNGFKGMVNGVIGFINSLISGVVNGINGIIGLLNKLKIDIPEWVPLLGGQTFGFNIKPLTAPQIPLLAKGAVLPANKPFLAVVGDQRHGTNVEAPLATIQEAVALVMNDQISAMMAGFQALLEEQQATRRTIESIEVGDSVIGEAALRYNRKMAVVYG